MPGDRFANWLRKALRWPTARGRAARRAARHAPFHGSYAAWIDANDTLSDGTRQSIHALDAQPEACVVLRPGRGDAHRTIDSLTRQLRGEWRLHLTQDDGAFDHPVLSTLGARLTRGPAIQVEGAFVVVLESGQVLADHALYALGDALAREPSWVLAYSDEDVLDSRGNRTSPDFKPTWSPDAFLEYDYISRSCAYRVDAFLAAVGDDQPLPTSEEITTRILARHPDDSIGRVPSVLFHQPSKPLSIPATSDRRMWIRELVEQREGTTPSWIGTRIHFPLPEPAPMVSIIIPTRDRAHHLGPCLQSLRGTTYPAWEAVIVDNGSTDEETLQLLSEQERTDRTRVVQHSIPFNFSELNNYGARAATGDVLCFLNDDTTVTTDGWLDAMVEHALRPGVGAVGALLKYPRGDVQHAGIVIGMGGLGLAGHVHRFADEATITHNWRLSYLQEYSAVTAACVVMKRDRFEEVGGFDERFAVCFNDVDLCLRLRDAGYRNLWTPHAVLDHHEQVSRGARVGAADRAYTREVGLMVKRWGTLLESDPHYSPNLALSSETPQLASRLRR